MALQEEIEAQGNFLFRHRSYFPLILLVIEFLVFFQTEIHKKNYPIENPFINSYYKYICLLVSFFGLFIRIYTVGHTPANTSGRNTGEQLADELNSTGIYSIVRHPLYLGNFFMWLGVAMLTENLWFNIAFVFIYWVYYERIMFAEEQFLRLKFGKTYTSWAERTPIFIPKFNQFVKPNLPFSLKKVLKQEKNALCAVFMLFFFLYASGQYIKNEPIDDPFLFYSSVFSILIYLVFKYLKKYSKIFDEVGR